VSPLPWDERWLPVALPVLAVVLAALGVRSLVARLAPNDRRAVLASAVGLALFGGLAGHDALGPDLAGAMHVTLGWAVGGFLALVGAGLALRRIEAPEPGSLAAMVLGLAVGIAPAAAWLAAEHALAFDDVREVTESRAQWRRRMAPGDATAWLALALVARARDENDHALAMAEVAETLSPDDERFRAELLELRSDVLAARGRCDEARALFDEALAARARAAMDAFDLDLSRSYRLPRALAAECGWAPE